MRFILQKTKKANLLTCLLAICLFSTQAAFSQISWKTTATTTSWADAVNWSTGAVPTANDDVIVIEGANVRVSGAAVCRKLQVNGGTARQGKVTIESGGTLNVNATNVLVPGGIGNAALVLAGGIIDNNGILTVLGRQGLDGMRFDEPTSGTVSSTYLGTGVLNCNTSNGNGGGGGNMTGICITFAQTSGTATFTLANTGLYNFTTGGTLPQGTPAFPTSKSVFMCTKGNAVINGTGSMTISGDKRAVRVVSVLAESANLTIESGVTMQLSSTMGGGNSGIVTVEINQADANSKLTNKGTLNFSGAKGNPIAMLCGINGINIASFVNEGTININGDFTDATPNVTFGGIGFIGANILFGASFTNASTGIINYNTLITGTSVKPLFSPTATGSPKFSVTNNGTITIGTNGAVTTAIRLGDDKTVFNNAGTLSIGAGNISFKVGTGTNAAFNNNTGGTISFPALATGSAVSDSVTFTNAGGTLRGSGVFSNLGGNVFNAGGIISPGQAAGAGLFAFNETSLTLNGTFNANVNGKTTAGTDFDRINAPNAAVNVAGLTIAATTNYAAVAGDVIVLINAASIAGIPTFTLPSRWVGSVSGGQVRMTAQAGVKTGEITEGALRVFPNPTADKVRITLADNSRLESAKATVYDLTGRQVLSQNATADVLELDMSNLSKGLYLLKIDANNRIYTEKIMRQ